MEIVIWKVLEGAHFSPSPAKPLYSSWQGEKLVPPQSRLWPSHRPSTGWWSWRWRWTWHLAVAAVNLWQMSLHWVTFNLATWVLGHLGTQVLGYLGTFNFVPSEALLNKQNVVKPKSNCWYFSLRSVRETKARALFWLWSFKSFHAVLIYTCIIYTSIYGWLYAGIIYTCEIITVPLWHFCSASNESVDALR